jgi:predicted transcriptional regulator
LKRVYTTAYDDFAMKEKTAPVTIRLTPSIKARLQVLADAERRTLSQFVGLVLERFLEEQEAKGAQK